MNNNQSAGYTVLVVDDQALVRSGLVSTVKQLDAFEVIAEAGSGEEGVKLARELKPDVVLMDLRMPGMGGLEAAHRISMTVPQCHLVAVTASEDEPYHRLSRSGFSASVGKSEEPAVLAATLTAVIAGKRPLNRDAGVGVRESGPTSPFDGVTSREMQVLMLMLQGEKTARIAEIMHIALTSVYTYRRRAFEKLGIESAIELAELARLHGVSPL